MKEYNKEMIVSIIKDVSEYCKYNADNGENNIASLNFANLLLDKVISNDKITLNKDEIESVLFDENGKVNNCIFKYLKRMKTDIEGVSFDNTIISGCEFSGLENVTIDLDKLRYKDLSYCYFNGVKLLGNLDNSFLHYTNFNGYIGDITLNTSKLLGKSLAYSSLNGISIVGSLDDININGVDFSGIKGCPKINPQKIPNLILDNINFKDTELVGEYNKETNTYDNPSFKDCIIYWCEFKNAKGNIIIDLDELKTNDHYFNKLAYCDLTGVIVKGNTFAHLPKRKYMNADNLIYKDYRDGYFDDFWNAYYYKDNEMIHILPYQSYKYGVDNEIIFINREEEPNLQMNVVPCEKEKSKKYFLLKKR